MATGFIEEQAEVIVDASRDALGSLVTKDDLKVVESALRNDMQVMELRLPARAVTPSTDKVLRIESLNRR